MNKRTLHLQNELRELVGKNISKDEFDRLLNELEVLYKASLPDIVFQERLKTKLKDLHNLKYSTLAKKSTSMFYLKLLGGLTTMFAGVFFLFHSLYAPTQNILENGAFPEAKVMKESSDTQDLEIGEMMMNDVAEREIEVEEPQEEVGDNATQSENTPPASYKKINSPSNTSDEPVVDQNPSENSSDTVSKDSPESVSSMRMMPEEKHSDMQGSEINNDDNSFGADNESSSYMQHESDSMGDEPAMMLHPESSSQMMMQGSMMSSGSVESGTGIQDICELHNGIFLEENNSCDFGSGNICDIESLFPESEKKCDFIFPSDN